MVKIMNDPIKFFNLESYIYTSNMYVFNEDYKLIKFDTPYDIIDYFYNIRLSFYEKRKKYLLSVYDKDKSILINRINFISGVISTKIKISNQPMVKIKKQLESLKFDKQNDSFDYLLRMTISSLTKEKIIELKSELSKIELTISKLSNMDISKLWINDLKILKKSL